MWMDVLVAPFVDDIDSFVNAAPMVKLWPKIILLPFRVLLDFGGCFWFLIVHIYPIVIVFNWMTHKLVDLCHKSHVIHKWIVDGCTWKLWLPRSWKALTLLWMWPLWLNCDKKSSFFLRECLLISSDCSLLRAHQITLWYGQFVCSSLLVLNWMTIIDLCH